jgi:hypothetical protein
MKKQPRNVIYLDGLPWIKRGGRLWGDYSTCSEYIGCAPSSFPVWVWRHGVTTIKHGRKSLALKSDLDQKSGAVMQGPPKLDERLPLRARHRAARG